jgi:hypothetical protein
MSVEEDFTAESFVSQIAKKKPCSLLEIVSVSTGVPFSQALSTREFANHTRVTYASEFHCQVGVQFLRFPKLTDLGVSIKSFPSTYDIAFLDPWHEVEDSFQIIEMALNRVRLGAVLLVHDCHVRDSELRNIKAPEIFPYQWCGSTWVAWSLLTKSLSHEFSWMTIDADYGIGVLKVPELKSQRRQLLRILRSLSKQWTSGNLSHPEWSDDPEHLHLVQPTDPRVTEWA